MLDLMALAASGRRSLRLSPACRAARHMQGGGGRDFARSTFGSHAGKRGLSVRWGSLKGC